MTTQPAPSATSATQEGWPAPAIDTRTGSGRRVSPYLVVTLAVVLVVAGVWLVGGFEKRTDLLTPVSPGATVMTGPYEIVLTEATARRTTGLDDKPVWELTALGTARVVGEESLSLPGTEAFAARNPATGAVVDRYFVREGTGGRRSGAVTWFPVCRRFRSRSSSSSPTPRRCRTRCWSR